MKAAEIKSLFPTEAALCDMFARDVREMGGWTVYPETAGFDILLVRDATGHQVGVEAKLALNAKVADQIVPGESPYCSEAAGPDFRVVIVPCITDASLGIAKLLRVVGVQVLAPDRRWRGGLGFTLSTRGHDDCSAEFDSTSPRELSPWDLAWHDWNPEERCRLPSIVPDVRAGVPAPVRLTPWKIGALRVIADLELDGFVTAKSVRAHGVDARRFCASDGWLASLGGGRWKRGTLPAFEQQHPAAYAQVLAEARALRKSAA